MLRTVLKYEAIMAVIFLAFCIALAVVASKKQLDCPTQLQEKEQKQILPKRTSAWV